MPDITVKYFDSTMNGAPALSGTAGALIGVLDACLINGFGTVTLNSLVVSDNVATATVNTGHNFPMVVGSNNVSPGVGAVITLAGATPNGLNGDWRIASVPNSTTFTFATSGISNQTASGTITAKRAAAGWTKAHSGTNKAAYARSDPAAAAMLLRLDDTPAQYPTLIMYESMSDIDTGSGPAPTSGSFYTAKSSAASSTARDWRLFADGRSLYLFVRANGTLWDAGFAFGDVIPYKSGDAYRSFLIAHSTQSTQYFYLYELNAATAALLARGSSGSGGAVAMRRYGHPLNTLLGVGGAAAYPATADGAFHGYPVEAWESNTNPRGKMPGLYSAVHAQGTLTDATLVTDVPQLSGGAILVITTSTNPRAALSLNSPWQ